MLLSGKRRVQAEIQLEFKLFRAGKKLESSLPSRQAAVKFHLPWTSLSLLIEGAFVWDQSGIRIIGIMQVSVCLGAILIPEYLDPILAILLPGAE